VAVDTDRRPCLEVCVKVRPHALGLRAERVAHEVNRRGVIMCVAVGLDNAVLRGCAVPVCQFSLIAIF
jgi:hypothetical protein